MKSNTFWTNWNEIYEDEEDELDDFVETYNLTVVPNQGNIERSLL